VYEVEAFTPLELENAGMDLAIPTLQLFAR
jgi:hypothetical protein